MTPWWSPSQLCTHSNYPALRMRESGVKQSFVSIYIYLPQNDKTASNTLNTYLYCFKSLPRTVHQILHLPSSLRSKDSLHGLRWGGFWIATPLPATQLRPGMISHAQLVSELLRAAHARSRGWENQEAFSEGSREPAISRTKKMQKGCTYLYPITIQGRLATYQTLRSSYFKPKGTAKVNC